MKKIVYLLTVLSLVFASCDPLEDVYSELDAQGTEDAIIGDVTITLTEEDYTNEVEDGGLGLSFANFNSEEQAKDVLPAFLEDKYPVFGLSSSALITYKLYAPKRTERSLIVYTVTSADYTAGGHSFGNFSRPEHITDFLNTKYPSPAERLLVSLTYKYYSGSVATLNNGFLFVNGEWEMITGFTDDEYEVMGEGFSNFSSEDEALAKIPVFLVEKFKYDGKVKGAIEGIMYKLYVTDVDDIDGDGRTDDRTVYSYVTYFVFDGANWLSYDDTIEGSTQFGHNGTTWVPDNTIKYTLTNADFALVGNGQFNNFDVRAGRDEETIEARLAKINTILLNNFPQYGEGQKFSVSYAVWKPGDDVFVMNVIHDGTEYVLQ